SIRILLCVCFAGSRSEVFWMDSLKCQTATASPAKPGELPFPLALRGSFNEIEAFFNSQQDCCLVISVIMS
ncbi:MAG: hypothetical protein ACLPY1_18200, partial [Terracidiphilus sp.]